MPHDHGQPVVHTSSRRARQDFGGGFIEFLFNGGDVMTPPRPPVAIMARTEPNPSEAELNADPARKVDPKFDKQMVDYRGPETPGTIIIDTPQRFLYLVQENGKAMRYGIGVGKPGFTWAGAKKITAKKEWPDWVPPPEMLQRRPDLPHFMAGGPENPLGARALYLGSSLYRIHGSNEPWTIGQAVSSGCIRMRNDDVIDLYGRVKVGTKVVVI
jgi:lipoprotein-anchoring transpeptidase ErfK/SrfK